jgi:hypothetical protein
VKKPAWPAARIASFSARSADRTGRRLLVAEALEVRLAERALPGERLGARLAAARHFPGAEAAVLLLALRDLGKFGRDPGYVFEGLHELNGTPARSAGERGATDRSG